MAITYEYLCEINNQEFEAEHSIKVELEECPICKERGLDNHKPLRLISGGNGRGIVNLEGREFVEKTKEDAKKFAKEVYSNEKTYANVISERKYHDIQTSMDRARREKW